MTSNWQPVETAPKDGTEFLSYEKTPPRTMMDGTPVPARHRIRVAWWVELARDKLIPCGEGIFRKEKEVSFSGFITGFSSILIPNSINPSHWQPLQPPPEP